MQRNSYQILLGSFRFCCNHFILLEFIWRYVFIVFRLLFCVIKIRQTNIISIFNVENIAKIVSKIVFCKSINKNNPARVK